MGEEEYREMKTWFGKLDARLDDMQHKHAERVAIQDERHTALDLKLTRVDTAITGDADYGVKGIAQNVKENTEEIKGLKKANKDRVIREGVAGTAAGGAVGAVVIAIKHFFGGQN